MDRRKHETANEAAKLPIDCLPKRKIRRLHPPATACSRQVANGLQNLAQINARRTSGPRSTRQHGCYPFPLLIGQIGGVAFGFLGDFDHPAAGCWYPHQQLESQTNQVFNEFSKDFRGMYGFNFSLTLNALPVPENQDNSVTCGKVYSLRTIPLF